jgi:hypothetical protein
MTYRAINHGNRKAYYARPISIDGTPQEQRDHELIRALGFEPWPVGQEKEQYLFQYEKEGMEVFRPAVQQSSILIFRAFPDGSIGAGVYKEIQWALFAGIPVVEIPRQVERRKLGTADTRDMLAELGQR